jgi:sensor domain CHASE-containing protein
MTDIALLLTALVVVLLIAIGGCYYFLWRIALVSAEADLIQKQLDSVSEEIASIQNEIEHVAKYIYLKGDDDG